jgi:hypothetical protein
MSPFTRPLLGEFKNLEFCPRTGSCGVKKVNENNKAVYNWDICPLQKKLSSGG